MEEKTNNRGGYRPGGGRPQTDRQIYLNVRISKEAADKLTRITKNKSEFIDRLIKEAAE